MMRQAYYCPNCRAPVFYGERFCGNCRTTLKWVIVKMPPEDSPLPDRQSGNGRFPGRQTPQYTCDRQKDCRKPSQKLSAVQHSTAGQGIKKEHVQGDTVQELRKEVNELLEHLFQKTE